MYLKLKEDIVYKSDDTGAILFNKFTNQFIELTAPEKELLENNLNKNIEFDENQYPRLNPYIYTFDKETYVDSIKIVNSKIIDSYRILGLRLDSCTLQITSDCNLDCSFCSESNRKCNCNNWFGKNTLDINKCLKFLNLMKDYGARSVNITGGDPLKQLERLKVICNYCMKNSLFCHIYTNGSLFTNEVIAELLQNIDKKLLFIHFIIVSSEKKYLNSVTHAIELLSKAGINFSTRQLIKDESDKNTLPFQVNEYEQLYSIQKEYKLKERFEMEVRKLNIAEVELRQKYNSCKLGSLTLCNDGNITLCLAKDNRAIISNIESDNLIQDISEFNYAQEYQKGGKCKSNCKFSSFCESCNNLRKYFNWCK